MAGCKASLAMAEEKPDLAVTEKLAKAFRPAKFEYSKVHFSGGLLKKPMPLTTKRVTDSEGGKTFVKMTHSEPWLIGAVSGQKSHGMLCRTTLLKTLGGYVEQACNGELDSRAAAEVDGDEYDPMQEIDVDDGTHSRSRGGGRHRPRSAPGINRIKQRTGWLP